MLKRDEPEDYIEEVLQQALSAAEDDEATDIEIRCFLMLGQLERRRSQVDMPKNISVLPCVRRNRSDFDCATDALCELAELTYACGVKASAAEYAKRAYEAAV